MGQKIEQLRRLAAVGYEKQNVVLNLVSMATRQMQPMKLAARPRLLSVATVFMPTRPLLPTPQTVTLPPAACEVVMQSTAPSRPFLASGSVWYSRLTCESAVASMESTLVARSRIVVDSGSYMVVGGVVIIRWRLHGLGEVCILTKRGREMSSLGEKVGGIQVYMVMTREAACNRICLGI